MNTTVDCEKEWNIVLKKVTNIPDCEKFLFLTFLADDLYYDGYNIRIEEKILAILRKLSVKIRFKGSKKEMIRQLSYHFY